MVIVMMVMNLFVNVPIAVWPPGCKMAFFPAAMVVIGAHYLPFITLYGMRVFGVLAAALVLGGVGLALYGPAVFSLGGWLTAAILIVFAFAVRQMVLHEEKNSH